MTPLILGTAQFGQPYGITNVQGQPTGAEVKNILTLAWESGVTAIDTAAAYGDAERILGGLVSDSPWRIISKIPKNEKLLSGKRYGRFLRSSLYQSLRNLGQQYIDTLLAHSAGDFLCAEGQYLYNKLRQFQSEGLVKKIGVSIYTGEEIDKICQEFQMDVVQLPINILDQRLIRSSHLQLLSDGDIEVHARSIFLQGVLLTQPNRLPTIFHPIKEDISKIVDAAADRKMSVLDLCLGFVAGIREVNGLVIGVNSKMHLTQVVRAAAAENVVGDLSHLALEDGRYLNPGSWESLA
jgi:aryl-alcohol dehydrogenase-like predicted oxidoreductase